mmetsp:Transcript_79644/g.200361  ORF Transcript_79644/g.200361 Transcript_79644/m.200361 type:complete len:276 (+) Transcript_79644:1521-2348(+)
MDVRAKGLPSSDNQRRLPLCSLRFVFAWCVHLHADGLVPCLRAPPCQALCHPCQPDINHRPHHWRHNYDRLSLCWPHHREQGVHPCRLYCGPRTSLALDVVAAKERVWASRGDTSCLHGDGSSHALGLLECDLGGRQLRDSVCCRDGDERLRLGPRPRTPLQMRRHERPADVRPCGGLGWPAACALHCRRATRSNVRRFVHLLVERALQLGAALLPLAAGAQLRLQHHLGHEERGWGGGGRGHGSSERHVPGRQGATGRRRRLRSCEDWGVAQLR